MQVERALGNIASVITIVGFLLALTQVSEFNSLDFDVSTDVDPIVGSLLFAFISIIIFAICFGYVFGLLLTYFEVRFGRMSLVFWTPIVGLISAFQTGVITLLISRFFEISSATTLLFCVSYFISAIIETMFVFRHCDIAFSTYKSMKLGGSYYPKYSFSISIVNHLFFGVGTLIFLADSKLVQHEGAWFGIAIGLVFGLPISYFFGISLYELISEENHDPQV